MLQTILAVVISVSAAEPPGIFDEAGLYLLRVTAVQVPNTRNLLGKSILRADEVLIGPSDLKGHVAEYKFVTPSDQPGSYMGSRYSGKHPDFACPTPRGQSRG